MNDPKAAAAYHPGDAPDTRPDLDAIQARAEAATSGPWTLDIEGPDYEAGTGAWHTAIYGPQNVSLNDLTPEWWRESFGHQVSEVSELIEADADFIVHAREDIPALLAALAAERARADQAATEAVREFLNAIPERIVTVSGRGGLREFAATWKPAAAPTAEQ